MCRDKRQPCVQLKRALRLLIPADRQQANQDSLRAALPKPTPVQKEDLITLIIQIVLALMENKEGDDKSKPDEPDSLFDRLADIAYNRAIELIDPSVLCRDAPKLAASIHSVAAMIPNPGFPSHRAAREAMRLANNRTLGTSAKNWEEWNAAIKTEMNRLEQRNYLTELADYKMAWTATADALDRTC